MNTFPIFIDTPGGEPYQVIGIGGASAQDRSYLLLPSGLIHLFIQQILIEQRCA